MESFQKKIVPDFPVGPKRPLIWELLQYLRRFRAETTLQNTTVSVLTGKVKIRLAEYPSGFQTKNHESELGNGLCDVGDFVYIVTAFIGPIRTGRPGAGNYIHAEVELADWADVDDDNEPVCSARIEEEES